MATGVPSSVTQSPQSRNFAAMKRFVVNYVQGANDAELLTQAGDEINSGIDRLNTRPWKWNIRRQDITLAGGTAEYDINSNYKKPRKLQRLNVDGRSVGHIWWRPPKEFQDWRNTSASDGTSEYYTVESPKNRGKLILDPPPGTAFVLSYPTLRFHYFARVPSLTQNGDVLDAPPEVWSLIAWYARWSIAMVRGEEGTKIDRAYKHWRETETALIRDDNNTLTDWELRHG